MRDKNTKERLLNAAIEEFAGKGMDGATVRDICSRAQVNVNAVKYYFEDKSGLHIAAVREAHQRVLADKPLPSLPFEGSPEEKLRSYILRFISTVLGGEKQNKSHDVLMLREMADPSETTADFVREYIKPRFQFLDETLLELLPHGTAEIDRHLLVFSVIAECLHYKVAAPMVQLLVSASEHKKLTVPRIAEHISNTILAAVKQHHSVSSEQTTPVKN